MPRRMEQLNDQLRSELAALIVKEIPLENGLITISYLECSPDLKHAKIGISVLPDNKSLSTLEKLKKHSSLFSSELRKKLKLRQIPRFHWVIDRTEKNAAVIDELFKKIEEEETDK